jgi:hypothetical protein
MQERMLVAHVVAVGRMERRRNLGMMRKVTALFWSWRIIVRMVLGKDVRVVRIYIACEPFCHSAFGTSRSTLLASIKSVTPTVLCSLHALHELVTIRSYEDRL